MSSLPNSLSFVLPQSNYGMKGQLSVPNPVMRLDREQQDICKKDFENIEYRFNNENHNFICDIMINVIQTMNDSGFLGFSLTYLWGGEDLGPICLHYE